MSQLGKKLEQGQGQEIATFLKKSSSECFLLKKSCFGVFLQGSILEMYYIIVIIVKATCCVCIYYSNCGNNVFLLNPTKYAFYVAKQNWPDENTVMYMYMYMYIRASVGMNS
jgi:hypothetical protein